MECCKGCCSVVLVMLGIVVAVVEPSTLDNGLPVACGVGMSVCLSG